MKIMTQNRLSIVTLGDLRIVDTVYYPESGCGRPPLPPYCGKPYRVENNGYLIGEYLIKDNAKAILEEILKAADKGLNTYKMPN